MMDKRIREGIEACRPDSDDVRSPEMVDVAAAIDRDLEARSFFDSVQGWDATISEAMESVPLPAGLSERLLARLRADEPLAGPVGSVIAGARLSEPTTSVGDTSPDSAVLVASSDRRWSRRKWIGAGACSAIAASMLISVGIFLARPPAEAAIENLAEDWSKQLSADPTDWRSVQSAPAEFAVPATIVASPVSWQPIGKMAKGVAYKLTHEKAGVAMLYVVRLARPDLPSAPPNAPQSTTGGQAVGYWRSGKVIYVLVVPGDERNYRGFVRTGAVPLA
jgi:hypothetical protein